MLTTETHTPREQRFTMGGQALPRSISTESGGVSDGLAKRLYDYALRRFNDIGLDMTNFNATVVRFDSYITTHSVEFHNDKGAMFQVFGIILNRGGWPSLDHGISLDED